MRVPKHPAPAPEELKNYLVHLRVLSGEYEKGSRLLVTAPEGTSAGKQAIIDESHHNELTWTSSESAHEPDHSFWYKVLAVKHVADPSEWDTLRKYWRH